MSGKTRAVRVDDHGSRWRPSSTYRSRRLRRPCGACRRQRYPQSSSFRRKTWVQWTQTRCTRYRQALPARYGRLSGTTSVWRQACRDEVSSDVLSHRLHPLVVPGNSAWTGAGTEPMLFNVPCPGRGASSCFSRRCRARICPPRAATAGAWQRTLHDRRMSAGYLRRFRRRENRRCRCSRPIGTGRLTV